MGKKFYIGLKKYPGVQYYESKTRRYNGKPDRCFYIRYKQLSGKMCREKVGWESEGYSAQYAANLRAERLRTIRHGDEALPIQKKRKEAASIHDFVIEKYLPWARENKISWDREEQLYRLYIKPEVGDKKLKEISSFDLEKIKKNMKELGRSPRTISYTLDVVRMIFNKAKEWNVYEGTNPATKVKRPKQDNKRTRFLSPDEAEALLRECRKKSRQLYEICLLSLYCGLRANEIFSLKWSDIDFDNKLIFIKDPKNRTSRVVYMTKEILLLLQSKKKTSGFVFSDRYGRKIKKVSRSFGRVVNRLGFNDGKVDRRDKVVFHTLRHTFASWLVLQGVPIYLVKELLGHKTLAMTERYSHLVPDVKREAIGKIPQILKRQDTVLSINQKP